MCHTLWRHAEGNGEGTYHNGGPQPAAHTYQLPASRWGVLVSACDREFFSKWHDDSSLSEVEHLPRGVELNAGQQVTITVTVEGAVLDWFEDEPLGCTTQAFAADDVGMVRNVAGFGVQVGGGKRAILRPGTYQVRTFCRNSNFRFGLNQSLYLNDAVPLVVADRDEFTMNVTVADYTNDYRTTEAELSPLSRNLPFCIDTTLLDGRIVERVWAQAGESGEVDIFFRSRGDRKLRFWDCFDEGFDDVWYPNSPDRAGGRTIGVESVRGPLRLEGIVQLIVDPELVCDGLSATIIGTPDSDVIEGSRFDDVIVGLGGNDIIRAGDGRDTICGGDGRDRLFGGRRPDRILGGSKGDLIKGGTGGDVILGEGGRDRVVGGYGDDVIRGGGGAADRLDGRDGDDLCHDISAATVFVSCETTSPGLRRASAPSTTQLAGTSALPLESES